MKQTVVCFGEVLIDFHAQAPSEPGVPPTFVAHAGGAPANAAVAIARLGGKASFIGMLGCDMFADMLLAQLRASGVAVDHVARTDAANTALAFVSHDAHGERSFSFYRPPAADLLFREADYSPAAFADAAVFHACSNSLTEAPIAAATLDGMTRARAAGALVSFDMNLRPALWARDEDPTPRVWQALALADLVKLSAEELTFLSAGMSSEQAVIERLWQCRASLLVVTDGAGAVRWFTSNREGRLLAFRVDAVDTTAAGDAFTGGLLRGLVTAGVDADGLSVLAEDGAQRDALLRFAAACGALAVTRTGSFAAMPTLAAVNSFLELHHE
ncbi:MAG: carbohydrate kinase family protein [Gammaproteobacteria bacterium]